MSAFGGHIGTIMNGSPLRTNIVVPGIGYDASGTLRYSAENQDAVLRALYSAYGSQTVKELGHGVLSIYPEKQAPILAQPRNYDISEPVIDFSSLISITSNAKPAIFYYECDAPLFPAIYYWLEGLKCLGYDIRLANTVNDLEQKAFEIKPDIVCFSGVENKWGQLSKAYLGIKEILPQAIMVLGGLAATSAAAEFFDIVIEGEGGITLPLILRNLQARLEDGKIRRERPVPWVEKYPELAEINLPPWLQFLKNTSYDPPAFSRSLAEELLSISAVRYLAMDHGDEYLRANVPIEGSLFIRSNEGIVGSERSRLPKERSLWPIPANQVELDVLMAQPVGLDPWSRDKKSEDFYIYAQPGCRGENRCFFCSIKTSSGRRMSVGKVISMMVEAKKMGAKVIHFGDDVFLQDPAWTNEWLDRIEDEKIYKDITIKVQIRADTPYYEIVERMWGLGIEIDAGFETLDPINAEKFGKVPKGGGAKYIAKTKSLLERGAEYARSHGIKKQIVGGYMIHAVFGNTIIDVAREIRLQLELIKHLWDKYQYLLSFLHNPVQKPHFNDRITAGLSGFVDAQPRELPLDKYGILENPIITLGKVMGLWHALGVKGEKGDMVTQGVFEPLIFEWDELVDVYRRGFNSGNSTDYRMGLKLLKDLAINLSESEAEQLKKETDAIEGLRGELEEVWKRLKDESGKHEIEEAV